MINVLILQVRLFELVDVNIVDFVCFDFEWYYKWWSIVNIIFIIRSCKWPQIEKYFSLQKRMEMRNAFTYKQHIIASAMQHKRISLVVRQKYPQLFLFHFELTHISALNCLFDMGLTQEGRRYTQTREYFS